MRNIVWTLTWGVSKQQQQAWQQTRIQHCTWQMMANILAACDALIFKPKMRVVDISCQVYCVQMPCVRSSKDAANNSQ